MIRRYAKNDSIKKLRLVKDPTIQQLKEICSSFATIQEAVGEEFDYMIKTAEIIKDVLEAMEDGGEAAEKRITDCIVELEEISVQQRK